MKTDLLIIFVRNPELGKVKTRLAKSIGDKKALEIYQFLLDRTRSITENLSVEKEVWYSEEICEKDGWNPKIFQKKKQHGTDLGARMQNAFAEGFKNNYKKIVLIGSDCYDLVEKDLKTAFEKLEKSEMVLGPAADGGYYLVGMKSLQPKIFRGKSWGTDQVLKETLADLNPKNLFLLQTRRDVDVYEDLLGIDTLKNFW